MNTGPGGASEEAIRQIEDELGVVIPDAYKNVLLENDGAYLDNGVLLYSSADMVERNRTFEVQDYAEGCVAIGDDSGGRSLVMCSDSGDRVFVVDQGSMDRDDFVLVSDSVEAWFADGMPLP